jgi:hypothetical protein
MLGPGRELKWLRLLASHLLLWEAGLHLWKIAPLISAYGIKASRHFEQVLSEKEKQRWLLGRNPGMGEIINPGGSICNFSISSEQAIQVAGCTQENRGRREGFSGPRHEEKDHQHWFWFRGIMQRPIARWEPVWSRAVHTTVKDGRMGILIANLRLDASNQRSWLHHIRSLCTNQPDHWVLVFHFIEQLEGSVLTAAVRSKTVQRLL